MALAFTELILWRDSSVAEFILSQILRSPCSLRMTEAKGSLRMTLKHIVARL
jgi:hypothetical protein